jgi:hypothetical protein
MFQSLRVVNGRVKGRNVNSKMTGAVPVLLGSLIALGWLMTGITVLRTLGAF